MGCINLGLDTQQRTAQADKSLENSDPDTNHSVEYIQTDASDQEFIQWLEEKRPKLKLPPASAKQTWEQLDESICKKLENLLKKSTLDQKLELYGDIIYQTCRDNP